MHNREPEGRGPEARERGLRLLRRLTTGVALAGVAGVGLFAAISAATIPGNAQAQTAPAASSSAASSSGSDASSSDDTVAAPAATPQPASTGPVHAVTGGS